MNKLSSLAHMGIVAAKPDMYTGNNMQCKISIFLII